MTITPADWKQYEEAHQKARARPAVTNEQRSEALRAREAISHPGFRLLQVRLAEYRTKMDQQLKTAEHRLTHGRGVDATEMHRLREDIAHCSGWLNALDVALDTLPELVKAVPEGA